MQATSRYLSAFVRPGFGLRGPTRSGVSSQHTAHAKVINVRIHLPASLVSAAALLSTACANPGDGVAPVSD